MDFQSNNLTIPRGVLIFAAYLPGTQIPGPYRQLGNCPEHTLTRADEKMPHYSSQRGMRNKDDEITIDSSLEGTVVTDDLKMENVRFWWGGEVEKITATAQTAQSETFASVKKGDLFQLGRSDTNPTGHRKLTNVVVTDGATPTPATLTLGVDYDVNLELAMVTFLLDKPTVTITYDVAASTREQIAMGDRQIEGELKFISFNATGPEADTTIPRAKLSANGDLSMLNDPESTAYQTLSLSISVLKKGDLALAYRDGRAVA